MPQPLLVCDAPALLYRAFFALPDSITDDDGHPVNALLGSVNQVLWCVEKYDPRAVVFCFGAVRPLADPDLPMHLSVGEWIVRHRAVPFLEPFAWTRMGEP